jgi:Holliday junction resolvase RusA-like endonuclease
MITITLPGPPIGKGRPRFRVARSKAGQQFVTAYTPAKTRAYERSLAWAGKAAMGGRKPLVGALRAAVEARMGVPSSWSAKKRDAALAGLIRPTGRPDYDNVAKTLDALIGIVFVDDAQIVEAGVTKVYAEQPCLIVRIEEVAPALWQEAAA